MDISLIICAGTRCHELADVPRAGLSRQYRPGWLGSTAAEILAGQIAQRQKTQLMAFLHLAELAHHRATAACRVGKFGHFAGV